MCARTFLFLTYNFKGGRQPSITAKIVGGRRGKTKIVVHGDWERDHWDKMVRFFRFGCSEKKTRFPMMARCDVVPPLPRSFWSASALAKKNSEPWMINAQGEKIRGKIELFGLDYGTKKKKKKKKKKKRQKPRAPPANEQNRRTGPTNGSL